MPIWVKAGYEEFSRRLPPECNLKLVEVPAVKRRKGLAVADMLKREGERMLRSVPPRVRILTLEREGVAWSTETLATRLLFWMREGIDVALLIGGPDGLAPACLQRADERWSLSSLTLPHGLVRVIVAEQLYRAWTTLNNHPYHRG
jgi:23S rRNA (pseudouridine1915-N3)-methyltransferase